MNLTEELFKKLDNLVKATHERDQFEVAYELEKARLTHAEEVRNLGNQSLRDAQVTLYLNDSGDFRKMAELRSEARLAYYEWASIKSLIDSNNLKGTNE